MNRIDDQLNRLFRAASSAKPGSLFVPPYGLETRVLAAWRAGDSTAFWDTGILVRGLILAAIILVLSYWPVVNQASSPTSDYLQLADSTVQIDPTTP